MPKPLRRLALPLIAGLVLAPAALRAGDVAIILDASNSMWGEIEGRDKIAIAREVVGDLLDDWQPGNELAVIAYGHRRKGDCTDIETVIPMGPLDPGQARQTIAGLQPRGKTPLTAALRHAAESLDWRDQPATVVLLSDGIETCNQDPCAAARALNQAGLGFTAYVVGFDVARAADIAGLRCIADNTGGQFFAAQDAGGLAEAMAEATELAVTAHPQPTPPPKPAAVQEVRIDAPDQAAAGAEIPVGWAPVVDTDDYVTIVPADAPDDRIGDYLRARHDQPGRLETPGTPGPHEVRYVLVDSREVVGRHAITLTDTDLTLTAPDQAAAGSEIPVSWDVTVNDRDYVTIVAADAANDQIGEYKRAGNDGTATLKAPGAPGLYEVRYVLSQGKRVLARQPLELTASQVTLTAPDQAPAGSEVTVTWDTTINDRDYITIVAADAADDQIGEYKRAGNDGTATLKAPGAPGLYEVRYVLSQGKRMLARQPIELTASQVTLTAPDQAPAGSDVTVTWDTTINDRDYVTIVAADAADDQIGEYKRAGNDGTATIKAPGAPGLYEVRYVLSQGKRVVARQPLELTASQVTLEAPATVAAGDTVAVAWSPTVHHRDYVTIVPADAADDRIDDYKRAGGDGQARLDAPDQPGLYEVRYVLSQGKRLIARQPLEVVAVRATIDSPEQVIAGTRFPVTWQGPDRPKDRILLVAAGADADAALAEGQPRGADRLTLEAPEQAGNYDLLYVLGETGAVISRTPFEVVRLAAGLEAPTSAAAGATITVDWQGPGGDRDRIALAEPDAAELTWIASARTAEGNPVRLTLPDRPGDYELRYIDVTNRTVLARRPITVE